MKRLVVGLGNPGKKYSNTRHNIGFSVLEPMFAFSKNEKYAALIAQPDRNTIIALPHTYMNESGAAVAKIAHFYKISPENIWIIHDDIDLPLGTLKISENASSAGHKGVESIISSLGTQSSTRFRIGIFSEIKGEIPTEKFVLQQFTAHERKSVSDIVNKTQAALTSALQHGIAFAKNELKKR